VSATLGKTGSNYNNAYKNRKRALHIALHHAIEEHPGIPFHPLHADEDVGGLDSQFAGMLMIAEVECLAVQIHGWREAAQLRPPDEKPAG
jgi:hypothetical protein